MDTDALIKSIRLHEKMCSLPDESRFEPGFIVREVCEIAHGIVAVRDADSDFSIYFDHGKYCAVSGFDISSEIDDFPQGVGLCAGVTPRNWEAVCRYAGAVLSEVTGEKIQLHPQPIHTQY